MKYFYGKSMSKDFVDNKTNVTKNKIQIKNNELIYFSKKLNKTLKIKAKFSVKQNKCIICKYNKFIKDSNMFGINYLMCQKCTHVFVDRRLTDKSIEKYYTHESTDSLNTYANKNLEMNSLENFIRKRFYKFDGRCSERAYVHIKNIIELKSKKT
jgi:Zn-finger nucleic acid-binding protein